jgi:predicted nucleic acid-binding protein
MSPDALLDTNVILRHVLKDHADHSPRATNLFSLVERGERAVRLVDVVVFEAVFVLERTYRVPRAAIRDALEPILDLPGIVLPGKRAYQQVFDLYTGERGLSFADCYLAVFAQQLGLSEILSFDQRLGRVRGIARTEPR